jgi:2-keto-4-pentenoate hydratase/2-oxohepta-3-ene-1,7-dioic acid hydratase in catechol pathway
MSEPVPAEKITDPQALQIVTRLNGEVMQDSAQVK